MLFALLGTSQGSSNEVTPRDDIEQYDFGKTVHRQLGDCDPKFKCEKFLGEDGRLVHSRGLILGLFGAGCHTKCINSSLLSFQMSVFGYNCGPCGP